TNWRLERVHAWVAILKGASANFRKTDCAAFSLLGAALFVFKSVLMIRVHPWLNFSFSDRLPASKKQKNFLSGIGPTLKEDLTQMSEARLQETQDPKPGSFCWVELG